MPSMMPAMRVKMGDTPYYILSMKGQELVDSIHIPKELEGWEDMSMEERFQRDINYARVRAQIAPYLAKDESRFFGAIIVAAMNFKDQDNFEPLSEMTSKGLPGLYRSAASTMGFLTLHGGETLVPLDGQHRLAAMKFAITGRDERGKDIPDVTPCADLANDDVTVVLVGYAPKKARRIFSKVNRYAKPTTKGQNLLIDDDDVVAVLTREIANDVIGARLVKYVTNTLTPKDGEFTTLSILYDCNQAILDGHIGDKIDKTELPNKSSINLYRDKLQEVWSMLLEKIVLFADALSDRSEDGDEKRREIRRDFLLGKPIPQACLVKAFVHLTIPPTNMTPAEACGKLNKLPWGITNDDIKVWDRVLWSGGKILAKSSKAALATDLIVYMAGGVFSAEEKAALLVRYQAEFPEEERVGKQLPKVFA